MRKKMLFVVMFVLFIYNIESQYRGGNNDGGATVKTKAFAVPKGEPKKEIRLKIKVYMQGAYR